MNRSQILALLGMISLVIAPVVLASDGSLWMEKLVTWIGDTLGMFLLPDG